MYKKTHSYSELKGVSRSKIIKQSGLKPIRAPKSNKKILKKDWEVEKNKKEKEAEVEVEDIGE